jgi:hypothetical protein
VTNSGDVRCVIYGIGDAAALRKQDGQDRTPADTGVDLLFFMPGVARFEYFRLIGRIRSGEASPQEILDTQERFDNHFQDSAIWQRFRDVS